ncbi:winged helix-turn-helix domain-containing protein [Rhizobium sp. CNPSo 3968]|uniref:winged helix-turn-helix domain-containing protein n=1 Tax=unclassified Rhizobium TaxID=2613769 RepID=UPI000DE1A549|nr:winged helix-turn-helix domain-containing protein [Rhizobium sp. CNPSo 3968]MBB3289116.1 putative ATPase/DNA-binding winged helix-turn-helix (wHTH) protein [Rhizobium sp. BK252]MBB3403858.1 putative ATPase/DNA-binding winged helix-turn-helix (wHTH) protein [Rhizobium sp. BK289]MBB3416473.1 putative ATPase/DNA-binding winged helix-turn-helix (wHTH) protein [Rhizobium sp. BK284]MBB3484321.1 putative ATPase/DNA-binding winged helix-turn-helix (wHTH) protein [Rhizobium sp. BK347]MDK4717976.1 wi
MNGVFKFGPFSLNPISRILERDGCELPIGSRAFDMLVALVNKQGEILSRRELMARAWAGLSVEDSNVRVQMAHLRRKLGCGVNGDRYIASIAGRGYSFVMPVEMQQDVSSAHSDDISDEAAFGDSAVIRPEIKVPIAFRSDKFLGRASNLEELERAVQERRLITVVGPGGVGKTTLATVLARSLPNFDEIRFVDLSVITDDALVAAAIASSVNPSVRSRDPLRDAVTWLSKRRSLLIVDNCEHVINGVADAVSFVLKHSLSTHVLATSIEALRVTGEAVYLLRPLGTPPNTGRMTANHALAWPSVELFMSRAVDGGHKAALADEEAAIVAAICRRLDGNPLAIELVASRVGIYGLDGVLELLDNQLTLRWRGDRDATPRHQTVQSLLDWSYVLLSKQTQTVLNRLSVFAGEFTIDATTDVVAGSGISDADVSVAISELVDKSMVSSAGVDQTTSALKLREMVRTYAAFKLAHEPKRHETQRRHALFYLRRMRARESGSDKNTSLHDFDIGNVRAALEWAFSEGGDAEIGAETCCLLLETFQDSMQFDECRRWCQRALELLPPKHQNTELHLKLLESLAIATLFGHGGDTGVASLFDVGLELSRRLKNYRIEAHLLAGLGLYHLKQGDFRSGFNVAEAYAHKLDRHGGSNDNIVAGWMLGTVYHMLGEQLEAAATYNYSLARTTGFSPSRLGYFEQAHLALAKIAQARVTWLRGSPETALQMAESAIGEARSQPAALCLSLLMGIFIFLYSGELDRADILTDELAELTATNGNLSGYHDAGMAVRGQLLVIRGEAEQSIDLLRGKLRSVSSIGFQSMIFGSLRALAEGLSIAGEHTEAISAIDTALGLCERAGGTYLLPELLRTKAMILLSSPHSNFNAVHRLLNDGTAIARRTSALGWELRLHLARINADRSMGLKTTEEGFSNLAEVVRSFQDGFETADLRAANSLLRQRVDMALVS